MTHRKACYLQVMNATTPDQRDDIFRYSELYDAETFFKKCPMNPHVRDTLLKMGIQKVKSFIKGLHNFEDNELKH